MQILRSSWFIYYLNIGCSLQKQLLGGVLKKVLVCNLLKKEALAQVFSYEFCKTSKNTFSYIASPMAASVYHVFLGVS